MNLFRVLLIILISSTLITAIETTAKPVPVQTKDQALYDQLPEIIKKRGQLNTVIFGSDPPYFIIQDNIKEKMEGVNYELSQAVTEILGIKIKYYMVAGFHGMLSGIQTKRYDIAFGPVGDFPDRHKNYDFIDFVKESDALIAPKGNPENIHSLADLCGKRIGVLAGGASEQIVNDYSKSCTKQNKAIIATHTYQDMPTGTLAVLSNRIDGMMESLATTSYFAANSQGKLAMTRLGIEKAEAYEEFYQGAILPKGSALTPVILAAYQKLFDNGTYAAIMKKWHLDENKIPAPGVNLSAKK